MRGVFKKRNDEGTPVDGASGTPVPATASATSQPETGTAEQPATQPAPPPPPASGDETSTTEEPVTEKTSTEQPTQAEPAQEEPVKEKAVKEKAVKEKPVKEKRSRTRGAKDDGSSGKKPGRGWSVDRVRTAVGRAVWLVCVLAAVALALSALMFALDFKEGNPLVNFFYELADGVDLGVFDVNNPLRTFRTDGQVDLTKITLLNYGVGAVVYLVAGRVLERIIRP